MSPPKKKKKQRDFKKKRGGQKIKQKIAIGVQH